MNDSATAAAALMNVTYQCVLPPSAAPVAEESTATLPSTDDLRGVALLLGIPFLGIPLCIVLWRFAVSCSDSCCRGRLCWFWCGNERVDVGDELEGQVPLPERLKIWLTTSRWGHRWMVWQILLTCFACTVLVAEFYLCSQSDSCVDLPLWIVSSEIFYSVFFVLDYLLYFYAASDRLAHFRDLHNLVDLLTILPVFALLPAFSAMSTTSNGFVAGRFLRALRAVRALRIIRAYRVLSLTSTGVRRQVMVIAFSILSMLFIFSCFILIIELEFPGSKGAAVDSFHMSVYWIVVTMSTVGYGDISPSSTLSRLIMMVMISVSWLVMSMNLAKLIQLIGEANSYGGSLRWSDDRRHVVIAGVVTYDGISHMLRELFHPSIGGQHVHVVVLLRELPTPELVALSRNPLYEHKLQLLVGSPLFDADLHRCRVRKASAVFLLTDKYAANSDKCDAAIILQALAVAEYAPEMRFKLYVQLIRRNAKHHLVLAGIPNVVSVDEMKYGLLGQAMVAPGLSTLITNLVRSFGHGYTNDVLTLIGKAQEIVVGEAGAARRAVARAEPLGAAAAVAAAAAAAVDNNNNNNDDNDDDDALANASSSAAEGRRGAGGGGGGGRRASRRADAPSAPSASAALPYHVFDNPARARFHSWQEEYQFGCTCQLRADSLSAFAGQPIGHVLLAIFCTNGATLFAIESWENNRRRIVVKPNTRRSVLQDDVGYFITHAACKDVCLRRGSGAHGSIDELVKPGRERFEAAANERLRSDSVAAHPGLERARDLDVGGDGDGGDAPAALAKRRFTVPELVVRADGEESLDDDSVRTAATVRDASEADSAPAALGAEVGNLSDGDVELRSVRSGVSSGATDSSDSSSSVAHSGDGGASNVNASSSSNSSNSSGSSSDEKYRSSTEYSSSEQPVAPRRYVAEQILNPVELGQAYAFDVVAAASPLTARRRPHAEGGRSARRRKARTASDKDNNGSSDGSDGDDDDDRRSGGGGGGGGDDGDNADANNSGGKKRDRRWRRRKKKDDVDGRMRASTGDVFLATDDRSQSDQFPPDMRADLERSASEAEAENAAAAGQLGHAPMSRRHKRLPSASHLAAILLDEQLEDEAASTNEFANQESVHPVYIEELHPRPALESLFSRFGNDNGDGGGDDDDDDDDDDIDDDDHHHGEFVSAPQSSATAGQHRPDESLASSSDGIQTIKSSPSSPFGAGLGVAAAAAAATAAAGGSGRLLAVPGDMKRRRNSDSDVGRRPSGAAASISALRALALGDAMTHSVEVGGDDDDDDDDDDNDDDDDVDNVGGDPDAPPGLGSAGGKRRHETGSKLAFRRRAAERRKRDKLAQRERARQLARMRGAGQQDFEFLSGFADEHDLTGESSAAALRNHVLIVVIGTPTEDIVDVIAPLRSQHLCEHRSIVVLFEHEPSADQWKQIGKRSSAYRDIQFIQGNPLLHLTHGSIHTAGAVLVLNSGVREESATGAFDATIVIISRSIESRHPNLYVLSELSEGSSIRFLGTGRPKRPLGAGAGGSASAAFLAARGAQQQQAHPQPLSEISMLSGEPFKHSAGSLPAEYLFRSRFAAGRVFAASMLDSLTCQAFLNPAVLAVVKLMLSSSAHSPKVYQVTVPNAFCDTLVESLYVHLVARDMLMLGLLRAAGTLQSEQPYVYTNPPPNTILHRGDRVFVLADEEPTATFGFRERQPSKSGTTNNSASSSASKGQQAPQTAPSPSPPPAAMPAGTVASMYSRATGNNRRGLRRRSSLAQQQRSRNSSTSNLSRRNTQRY